MNRRPRRDFRKTAGARSGHGLSYARPIGAPQRRVLRRGLADVIDEIVVRTDGVPLFVEEMTKTVLEAGAAGGVIPFR